MMVGAERFHVGQRVCSTQTELFGEIEGTIIDLSRRVDDPLYDPWGWVLAPAQGLIPVRWDDGQELWTEAKNISLVSD